MRYCFYKVAPEWKRLSADERVTSKHEFASTLAGISEKIKLRTFSLSGIRGDTDFLIWLTAPGLDELQAAGVRLNATHLGRYSTVPYSYVAITRPSPYLTGARERPKEAGFESAKYLFVYPFVKRRDWYGLPHAWRKDMMMEHIGVSTKYPSVKINTGYSFGLDDQEHMVAFETDSASEFLDLVMALRETQQSAYTLSDTPAFTCVTMGIEAALDAVAG